MDFKKTNKNKTHLYAAYKRFTSDVRTHTDWSEEIKKKFYANRNQKKAVVAILISDKLDFKTKTVIRDKKGHYIMIKGSIQKEDITFVHISAPNIRVPKYIKQILTDLKGEIAIGDFNILLTSIGQADRKSVRKTFTLNNTL